MRRGAFGSARVPLRASKNDKAERAERRPAVLALLRLARRRRIS